MAEWNVSNKYKKTVEETDFIRKDGVVISRGVLWRGGEWLVTTKTDDPPVFDEESNDMVEWEDENIEEIEFLGTWDGCDQWFNLGALDESLQEGIQEICEDDWYLLEDEHGWEQCAYEMYVYGPLNVEKRE